MPDGLVSLASNGQLLDWLEVCSAPGKLFVAWMRKAHIMSGSQHLQASTRQQEATSAFNIQQCCPVVCLPADLPALVRQSIVQQVPAHTALCLFQTSKELAREVLTARPIISVTLRATDSAPRFMDTLLAEASEVHVKIDGGAGPAYQSLKHKGNIKTMTLQNFPSRTYFDMAELELQCCTNLHTIVITRSVQCYLRYQGQRASEIPSPCLQLPSSLRRLEVSLFAYYFPWLRMFGSQIREYEELDTCKAACFLPVVEGMEMIGSFAVAMLNCLTHVQIHVITDGEVVRFQSLPHLAHISTERFDLRGKVDCSHVAWKHLEVKSTYTGMDSCILLLPLHQVQCLTLHAGVQIAPNGLQQIISHIASCPRLLCVPDRDHDANGARHHFCFHRDFTSELILMCASSLTLACDLVFDMDQCPTELQACVQSLPSQVRGLCFNMGWNHAGPFLEPFKVLLQKLAAKVPVHIKRPSFKDVYSPSDCELVALTACLFAATETGMTLHVLPCINTRKMAGVLKKKHPNLVHIQA